MAIGDDIKKANEEIKGFQNELGALDNQLKSLGLSIQSQITDNIKSADEETQKLAKSYSRDITNAINQSAKGLNNYQQIQDKVNKGYDIEKELIKETQRVQKQQQLTLRKIEFLKREGVKLNIDEIAALEEAFSIDQKILKNLEEQNKKQRESLGIAGKLADGVEGVLNKIGAGGVAKLFNFKKAAAEAAVLKKNKKSPKVNKLQVYKMQRI